VPGLLRQLFDFFAREPPSTFVGSQWGGRSPSVARCCLANPLIPVRR
jgi:hypothetical protein